MARRIAIVEDEDALRENYLAHLQKQGYDVAGYATRAAAEKAFATRLPDLVILDISLGDDVEAGFSLCQTLRAQSQRLPIIFLTARDSDYDAISGLRLGADDYLTKSITMPQLLARIHALFRRIDAFSEETPASELHVGPLSMDVERVQLTWQTQPVALTLTEFWIVHSLIRYPGHVKHRDQLMQDANVFVDDSTITSHIKRIRKKFKQLDPDFDHIETIYGMGYRWLPDGVPTA